MGWIGAVVLSRLCHVILAYRAIAPKDLQHLHIPKMFGANCALVAFMSCRNDKACLIWNMQADWRDTKIPITAAKDR